MADQEGVEIARLVVTLVQNAEAAGYERVAIGAALAAIGSAILRESLGDLEYKMFKEATDEDIAL